MRIQVPAILDPQFTPLSVVYRDFQRDVAAAPSQALAISIIRNGGLTSTFRTRVFADGVDDARNIALCERLVKSLVWVRGGYEIVIAGSRVIYEAIAAAYAPEGLRSFDYGHMFKVYERKMTVRFLEKAEDAPADREGAQAIGRHLDGCRIGFDAGGSDRKVSAVIDGEPVYSEEVVWFPKTQSDPKYHYDGILTAMKTAAAHMPRVDAIGVSSAGIYVDNRIMTASLFLKVSPEDHEKYVKNMYIDIAREIGDVPLTVANDGDVTALAGAMELRDNAVLGVAMGTSEAGGYVDPAGNITGWLNELAFVPVDACKDAMADEWSGDYGCGVKYFSQDAVIKLAPAAGIALDDALSPAEKLKVVQNEMKNGNPRAADIYRTIGVYFGYALAYYSLFYEIRHVLIMGRVTSGEGGPLILEKAREVLETEFPALAAAMQLHIPDETSRRVGQSVAAASLPKIG